MADTGPGGVVSGPAVLYRGLVVHERLKPSRNRFAYPVFFLRLDVDRLDEAVCRFLSVDRFNVFSVHRRDHGARDGTDPAEWIRRLLEREGCGYADGGIWLQTFPRVLGYVFNPVSFWLCHDREGRLRAVLCEVNNTFGEHHNYLLTHSDARPIAGGDMLEARKVFHVSPFLPVKGRYRFQFQSQGPAVRIRIDYEDENGKLLVTSVSGAGRALTPGRLFRCFVGYPWMTAAVTARIHWQALRLWWKGVPFFAKPAAPARETSR